MKPILAKLTTQLQKKCIKTILVASNIVTRSLKKIKKILILMIKIILKYQYVFEVRSVSVTIFENQNTKYNYQYTDTW